MTLYKWELASQVCSFVINLEEFPVFMFKSMDLSVLSFLCERDWRMGRRNCRSALLPRSPVYSLEGRVWNSSNCHGDRNGAAGVGVWQRKKVRVSPNGDRVSSSI